MNRIRRRQLTIAVVAVLPVLLSATAGAQWTPIPQPNRPRVFDEPPAPDVTDALDLINFEHDEPDDAPRPARKEREDVELVDCEESAASCDPEFRYEACDTCDACCFPHTCQILPDGLMYKSYLAGPREPRMGSVWLYERGRGWIWETAIGGRVGVWRNGTTGPIQPQGYQVDVEGAVFPRIDPIERSELDAVDFRIGMLLTHREGQLAWKVGYYHISSHLGDEYMLTHPTAQRIEYVRDSAIAGLMYDVCCDVTIYGEVGYAIGAIGGAEPLEFQFGAQFSPVVPTGMHGSPFAGANVRLLEDFGFSGNVNVVWGWQWRGTYNDHLFRAGFQYYDGNSLQTQFFDKYEQLLGLGFWYDY